MNTEQLLKQYKEHAFNVGELHVKLVGNNVADVFSGDGFGVPSRIRKVKGLWQHISGPKLDGMSFRNVVENLS